MIYLSESANRVEKSVIKLMLLNFENIWWRHQKNNVVIKISFLKKIYYIVLQKILPSFILNHHSLGAGAFLAHPSPIRIPRPILKRVKKQRHHRIQHLFKSHQPFRIQLLLKILQQDRFILGSIRRCCHFTCFKSTSSPGQFFWCFSVV